MADLGLDMLLRKDEAIDDAAKDAERLAKGDRIASTVHFTGTKTFNMSDSVKSSVDIIQAIMKGEERDEATRIAFLENLRNKETHTGKKSGYVAVKGAEETKLEKV